MGRTLVFHHTSFQYLGFGRNKKYQIYATVIGEARNDKSEWNHLEVVGRDESKTWDIQRWTNLDLSATLTEHHLRELEEDNNELLMCNDYVAAHDKDTDSMFLVAFFEL